MPNTTSYLKTIGDWKQLLAAVADNSDQLAEAERHRAALQQHLAEVETLKAKQKSATAIRQETTQQLKALLESGRELAMRVRGIVKANVGPKNERLVQFGMAPLRKRPRRTEKPTEGETLPPPVTGKADPSIIH